MVAVIAWVHFMSSQLLSDKSTFSEESFAAKFAVGKESFADEFLKQKRTSHANADPKPKSKRKMGPRKAATGPPTETADMILVGEAEDEIVRLKRKMDREAFAVYRNHYDFG